MADSVQEAGFWLPSEFFDDFLMDKEKEFMESNTEPEMEFCFPTEFPYLKTESDEEEYLTLFTPQPLEISTSPQSTLTHDGIWSGRSAGGSSNGSPNGPSQVPSPPTTPLGMKNDVSWDLIYQAAGQVAKLKLNNDDCPIKQKGFLGLPRTLHQIYPVTLKPSVSVPPNTQGRGILYGQPDMYQNSRVSQVAVWTIPQNPSRVLRPPTRKDLLGGPGGGGMVVKRVCAGTGVFLPRRYGNYNNSNNNNNYNNNNTIDCNIYSSVTRRKLVHYNPQVPNRAAVDYANHFSQSRPLLESQSMLGRGFSNHDLLVARRNAELLMARKRAYLLMTQGNVLMLQHSRRLLSDGSATR